MRGSRSPRRPTKAAMPESVLAKVKWVPPGSTATSRLWAETSMPTKGCGEVMVLELPSLQIRAPGPRRLFGLTSRGRGGQALRGLEGPRARTACHALNHRDLGQARGPAPGKASCPFVNITL